MEARASDEVAVSWAVLDETPTSLTDEWSIAGFAGHPDQVKLARLLQGNDGLHRVAFTQRGPAFSAGDRARWLEDLAKAQVVKGIEDVVHKSD